jgi:diadenosine tetraphosphate (Ap4A) HIT family hydrolase
VACRICELLLSQADDRVVLDDGTWCAYQVANVPGWITLATKHHVDGPESLTDLQTESLGRHIRAIGEAVKRATGAERVHVVYLGEAARHFHAGFFPRMSEQQALLGNERLLAEVSSAADPPGAATIRTRVRDLLR